MIGKRLGIALLIAILLVAGIAIATRSMGLGVKYETPSYSVVEKLGTVEVRQYEPYLVAEASVDGSLENAGNEGFRILAGYIFGDNQGDEKITMTAPVSQEKAPGSKIKMTAPVTQEQAGDQFKIQFMMPSKYALETLPKPNNPRIQIREVPGQRFAAIRYSGRWTKKNYEENLERLRATLTANNYQPTGEPVWARYNPPFMPWFLRKNEILIAFQ